MQCTESVSDEEDGKKIPAYGRNIIRAYMIVIASRDIVAAKSEELLYIVRIICFVR